MACRPGFEDKGGVCQPCPIGFYRVENETAVCTRCENDTITEVEGANSSSLCNLRKMAFVIAFAKCLNLDQNVQNLEWVNFSPENKVLDVWYWWNGGQMPILLLFLFPKVGKTDKRPFSIVDISSFFEI